MKLDRDKISIALMSVGTVLIITAITLFALVVAGVVGGGNGGNSSLATIAGFGEVITKPTPGSSPTPAAQYPPGDNAPVERLIIDKAQIDAPVVVKGVDDAGVMQSPDNAYDTAWYDFSAHPGSGGNAVFSGHVDYIHVGKAVFWYIKDLEQGDLVQVRLVDGTVYKYAVTSKNVYDAATAPVDQIVGPTPTETVTLITCGGTFDSATHQYDKRTVVRAERILDSAPGALPAAPSGVVQR